MTEKYCPGLEFRTFVFNKKKQRCTTDDTYSPKSQCICHKGSFAGLYTNSTTELKTGVFRIGTTCLSSSSDSCSDVEHSENSQISHPPTLKEVISLDSATRQWSGAPSPKPICFANPESLRSLLSIWYRLRSSEGLQGSSSCTGVSTPSIPQPSTSVCPSSAGHFSAAQSPASKSTLRLTSSPRYPYSTESPMPKPATVGLWTGLNTNPMPVTSSTVVTSTSQGSSESISVVHSSSSGRKENTNSRFSTEKVCLTGRTACS